jgi:hypothetical protein
MARAGKVTQPAAQACFSGDGTDDDRLEQTQKILHGGYVSEP